MRPERLKTFDYIGCHHYYLTFCTFRRNRYFEDTALVRLVELQFARTAVERDFEELAYCYMPDHLHILVAGTREDSSFVPYAEVMRQRSARAAKASQRIRLWQDGYFERVLRDDEELGLVARYVFENPVRANLVGNAKDWPHSGGRFWPFF
jgi:putative transposase